QLIFSQQLKEIQSALNVLIAHFEPPWYQPPTAPSSGIPTIEPNPGAASVPLIPAPPGGGDQNTIPLTSKMDLLNAIPDTDMDGIVQVPFDDQSMGDGTGSITFQPDRGPAQVFIPLNNTRYESVPIHAYVQQGAFQAAGGDTLTARWLQNNSLSYGVDE